MTSKTIMEQESEASPVCVATQLHLNESVLQSLVSAVNEKKPQFIVTIGRGSSDNACTFAKYIFETKYHIITASAAPSVVTLYHAPLDMSRALVIGISQSGQSPDLCEMMETARKSNALTVAFVNNTESTLAKTAEFTIPLHAGEERAVAATKSYITSLTAITHFAALLTKDQMLLNALARLPETLQEALTCDWSQALAAFKTIDRTLIIGRGYGFPIAQEAALKLKETSSIQAEAFSAAEVLHGPFALIKKNYPFLLFAQNDLTWPGTVELVKRIDALGGKPFIAGASDLPFFDDQKALASHLLHLPPSLHPIVDPIVAIVVFYCMAARLAVERGYNPDQPLHLKKVTKTR